MLNYFTCYKTFLTRNTEIFIWRNCAQTKLWHAQKFAFVFLCTVQICDFCIWKIICAADLRILCTTHFCTFAHLSDLCTTSFRTFADLWKWFCEFCAFVKIVFTCSRIHEFVFFTFSPEFSVFVKFAQNVEKVEISENVPKMSEKSSRVPEWYTSGSWANAFDNTGWQKSPEYALIRIAAGAPDLAKSGQIRPRTAPDGKSSRIWRRFRFCSTGWNPVRSCFFPDTRTDLRSVDLFPRRVEFCDRVRHILQMCAHDAKHSLKTAVRAQDILHTVHTRAQPKPTHVHKLCTPETQTCTLVHNRATSPDTSGREHIVHVLLLLGGGRRADASFCIEHM